MAVSATMSAGKRRLVYGLNVGITIVLAVALLAIVVWAAGAYGKQIDVTRTGLNSLSPRTVQLLEKLDQPITITGLYSTALKEVRPYAEKRRKRVADLLDLYETAAGGKVTAQMIDPEKDAAKVTRLLARLREKPAYKDEAKPHAEALARFPELNKRVAEFLQNESTALEQLVAANPAAGRDSNLAIIQRNLRVLLQNSQDTETTVRELQAEEVPRYGQAISAVKEYLTQLTKVLKDISGWMGREGGGVAGLGPQAGGFFQQAPQRYQPIVDDAQKLLDEVQNLKKVKLEELYDRLKRGSSIVVENSEKAEVLSLDDVWPWRTDRNAPEPPDGDPRDFAGEQAVSSAILKLTQKKRTAVIFTRYGGEPLLKPDFSRANPMQMPQAPYEGIKDVLEKQNFITAEWDVKTQPEPPEVKDAARVVYVVFPPAPPPQSNPMRPAAEPPISEQQKQRVIDAVSKSGMAIFLTHWEPPASQFIPTPGRYAFKDYLKKTWGIEVEDGHLTLEFAVNPQRENLKYPVSQRLLVTSRVFHYTDQTIGKPLAGLPAAFQAVAPLKLLEGQERPAGVELQPIVVLNDTEDVWAISNLSRINDDLKKKQGTRRYDDDIPAPFPLAVAATRKDGDQTRKLVVFASDTFISDNVMNMSQMLLLGGALRLVKLYPANRDLFLNALYWLTGDADRIAVGPQRGEVPRLTKLKEGPQLTFTQIFLVGIWPGLALLVGAGVWLMRRR